MDRELDEKLVKSFPLLYADRYRDMRQTCMVWGFPNRGWFQIIWELSEKLESLIQDFVKNNSPLKCVCGCDEQWHTICNKKCLKIHYIPYSVNLYHSIKGWNVGWMAHPKTLEEKIDVLKKKVKYYLKYRPVWFVQRCINKFLYFLHKKFDVAEMVPCNCEEYRPNHPRAAQVKEKFASLRFYMTSYTDEMHDLIDEAERKSKVTCEDCGDAGVLRDGGWLRTLCDKCATKEDGTIRPPKVWPNNSY